MRILATLLLSVGALSAEEAAKPPCTPALNGQLWPAQANSDKALARKLFQTGDLELCSVNVWRYRWQHMSVSYKSLQTSKPNSKLRSSTPTD